ncbi:MAG: 4-(cytidine 5'-diphospho)-2-C-methyl-D-erythritol kinase [Desulfobacterota bacterium]|nr:4-(cytidine 5'-diphospho)-2-C-methyl-D-erythritol kinase [Thermodesulfobacteriota bacterium]
METFEGDRPEGLQDPKYEKVERTLFVLAPAKVNLRLEVLRKRPDGYHEIRTIFQKISLFDSLRFSLRPGRGIRITTDHPTLPTGERNLVYRAVKAFLKETRHSLSVEIHIKKGIPIGAGLGGGSSDAAAGLDALNRLLKTPISRKRLMEMGREIGADVPFFLFNGSAIGRGVGDRLRKIELPRYFYVLIYPNFEVSTRWAYENFILTKRRNHFNLQWLLRSKKRIPKLLRNDLEGVVSQRYPEISLMKEMLLAEGAKGALMSGSGPTVFGLFNEEGEAQEAFEGLSRRVRARGWRIFMARGLP